jgi:hypothetical protein
MSPSEKDSEFAAAARSGRRSLPNEILHFVRTHRRWSLIPILLALAVLGAFVTLTGTGLAPLIYTLF